MREIKFRRAHFNKDGFMYYTYWGKINHKGKSSIDVFCSPASVGSSIKAIDEQYTGLKDKNGKEIYEGDAGVFDIGENVPVEIKIEGGAVSYWSLFNMGHKFEITGNIHENRPNE